MPIDPHTLSIVAWGIFAGAGALAIFLGVLVAYHWYTYAASKGVVVLATVIYIGGSLACLSYIASTIQAFLI